MRKLEDRATELSPYYVLRLRDIRELRDIISPNSHCNPIQKGLCHSAYECGTEARESGVASGCLTDNRQVGHLSALPVCLGQQLVAGMLG